MHEEKLFDKETWFFLTLTNAIVIALDFAEQVFPAKRENLREIFSDNQCKRIGDW